MRRKADLLGDRIRKIEKALQPLVKPGYVVLETSSDYMFGGTTLTIRPKNPVHQARGFELATAPGCFFKIEEHYLLQGSTLVLAGYFYGVTQQSKAETKEVLLYHYHPLSEKANTRWTKQPHIHFRAHLSYQKLHIPTVGSAQLEDDLLSCLLLELCSWVQEELSSVLGATG